MPYNNTPIAPNKEATGTVSLPLARVKKIIHVDPEVGNCSNNAAFAITVATEMFLQYLVEQSYNQVKSEHSQKPRRNIQYRDVANAVARVENLEFLGDVVPRPITFKQFKTKAAKDRAGAAENGEGGQATLDSHLGLAKPAVAAETMDVDADEDGSQQAEAEEVDESEVADEEMDDA